MYFSKIEVQSSNDYCENRELWDWLKENDFNEYSIHQLLWKTFELDPNANRSFIFRIEKDKGTRMPMFYMVSKNKPINGQGVLNIVYKEYAPKVTEGKSFFFDTRLNPVIARVREGKKHSAKHDLWMDAKKRGKKEGLSGFELTAYIESEVISWFYKKAENSGFSINKESLVIESYAKHKFLKSKNISAKYSKNAIEFNSIDFKGILTVNDSEKFENSLFNGIGRSKAFGCGLVLIKPCI